MAPLFRTVGICVSVALATSCSGDDDDGDVFAFGTPAVVQALGVTDARSSPATVTLVLADAEDQPTRVVLEYFEPGSATPKTLTLVGAPSLASLAAAAGGTVHTFQWDFVADLGSASFRTGFQVRASAIDGLQSIASTATAANLSLGNDAPTQTILSPFSTTLSDVIPLEFVLADSSGDRVDVMVEYDLLGDVPDLGFRPARPAGLDPADPTPTIVLKGVQAPKTGIILSFSWDSRFDVGAQDGQAILRVTADDGVARSRGTASPKIVFDNNASASVVLSGVLDTRESPATLAFDLFDTEGDPQRVGLFFLRPGSSTPEPLTLAQPDPVDGLPAGPTGSRHTRLWDFSSDLGSSGFLTGLAVQVDVLEGSSVVATGVGSDIAVGNDPPEVRKIVAAPSGEVEGPLEVTFEVADSSDDEVRIRVDYDIVGDSPDAGFALARPVGIPRTLPTPTHAVDGLPAESGGILVDFLWDAEADLGAAEVSAVLRFTPEDDLVPGTPFTSGTLVLDNNRAPKSNVDVSLLAANQDGRRGVPIPFEVSDDEGDSTDVFVQWRLVGESFPALPADTGVLRQTLRDPASRRRLQIGTPYPVALKGRALPVDATRDPIGVQTVLPEIGPAVPGLGAASGLRLEILRAARRPEPTGNPWTLAGPVAALPAERGTGGPTALVLDSEAPGSWRLREMHTATGSEIRLVAGGSHGEPAAMDFQRNAADRVVVAVGDGTDWSVLGVQLSTGTIDELVPSGHASRSGLVRAIASVDRTSAVLSVGTALVRVSTDPNAAPTAVTLLSGFAAPAGVAADPRSPDRVFVADTGAVFEVDLETLMRTVVSGAGSFVRPGALAVSPDGSTLAALCDADPGDSTFELCSIPLGIAAATFELASGIAEGGGGLSLGSDGLVLLALPGAGDLAIGGGVQQVRGVASLDAATLVATADAPFDPPLGAGSPYRLSRVFDGSTVTSTGARGVLAWDSRDVGRSASVVVRVVALDTDAGTAGESFAREVVAPLDVDPLVVRPASLSEVGLVETGDLDGDGARDLVVADPSSGTIEVLLQLERGVFGGGTTLEPGGGTITDLAVVDVDGDDVLDLVVATDTDVRLLLCPGSLVFMEPESLGTGATSLTAADLDGDGLVDLALTDFANDTLELFFGSSGGFASTPDATLSNGLSGPRAVSAADLTGNGSLDLAVANGTTGEVAIFFQGAARAFGPAPDRVLEAPTASAVATTVALADLDGDGDRDVVVGYANADVLAVHLQEPAGDFAPPTTLLGGAGRTADPRRLRVADLDHDGDLDFAVSVGGTTGIAAFLQQDGAFSELPDLELDAPGALGLVAEDLNGDARTDLAAATGSSAAVVVYLQSRPGDFASEAMELGEFTGKRTFFVEAADLDGDGDLDLALAHKLDESVGVHLQVAPGVFGPSPTIAIDLGEDARVTSLASGDLDGDGDVDLAAALDRAHRIGLLIQTSPGVFEFDAATGALGTDSTTPVPRFVELADLDSDGALDVIAATGNELALFLRGPSGTFPTEPQLSLGGTSATVQAREVHAADLDGDGDVDLIGAFSGEDGSGIGSATAVYWNEATGFREELLGATDPTDRVRSAVAGDFDSDGDLDVISAQRGSGTLVLYAQIGPGTFGPGVAIAPERPFAPIAVRAVDIDGDGDDDVIAVDAEAGRAFAFVQEAPGRRRLDERIRFTPLGHGAVTVDVAIADLDEDGDIDVVTADSVGGIQTIHFGGR